MKIEEQPTPINEYEIHTKKMYVAVFYYKSSLTPFATTCDSKEQLLQNLRGHTSIDESRAIKIFTLIC